MSHQTSAAAGSGGATLNPANGSLRPDIDVDRTEATVQAHPDVDAIAGLSAAEAARRLGVDGANALPDRHRVGLVRRVLLQLRDPLILVLLVAAVLTIATGDWTDASVIVAVILINTSVGVVQEVKADRAITALSTMTAPGGAGTARRHPAADPRRRCGRRRPPGPGRRRHRPGGRRGARLGGAAGRRVGA